MANFSRDLAHEEWMRQRLQAAVDQLAGGSADKLGRMMGYTNGGFIREILRGVKPVGKAVVSRMTQVVGAESWFARAPESSVPFASEQLADYRAIEALVPSPVDQSVIHRTAIITPRTINWGDLVSADLSSAFQMVLPDRALEPDYAMGDMGQFTTGAEPRPGRPVLIRDRSGAFHLRVYQLGAGGRWQGVSKQPGYGPLDSESDGVVVVAPMTGHVWA